MADVEKKIFYTIGCGSLQTNVLISHLNRKRIKTVIDVRETPKSQKRPWFNRKRLSKDISKTKMVYIWIGDKLGASSWETGGNSRNELQVAIRTSRQPICFLGLRADPKEDHRIQIAQYIETQGIGKVKHLEVQSAFKVKSVDHSASWKELNGGAEGQIESFQRKMLQEIQEVEDETLPNFYINTEFAVKLDQQTILLWRRNLTSDVQGLIQNISELPFTRPLRQITASTGVRQEFQEHHSEIWLSNEYHRSDRRRVGDPIFSADPIPDFLEPLILEIQDITACTFNGIQIYREPKGAHPKDGPHTYATELGLAEFPIIAMISLGYERTFRLHSTKSSRLIDIPLISGSLIVLGGAIKQNWLYSIPRDSNKADTERFLLVLQMYKNDSLKI